MRLRRKKAATHKSMPGFRLEADYMHGKTARVFLGDQDVSACVQRVEVDCSVDDANRVVLHTVAADLRVDFVPGEIKVIERAYQVSRPNPSLESTPVRQLLSEIEEA